MIPWKKKKGRAELGVTKKGVFMRTGWANAGQSARAKEVRRGRVGLSIVLEREVRILRHRLQG